MSSYVKMRSDTQRTSSYYIVKHTAQKIETVLIRTSSVDFDAARRNMSYVVAQLPHCDVVRSLNAPLRYAGLVNSCRVCQDVRKPGRLILAKTTSNELSIDNQAIFNIPCRTAATIARL
jgi:recombinational DNA repair protein RecR